MISILWLTRIVYTDSTIIGSFLYFEWLYQDNSFIRYKGLTFLIRSYTLIGSKDFTHFMEYYWFSQYDSLFAFKSLIVGALIETNWTIIFLSVVWMMWMIWVFWLIYSFVMCPYLLWFVTILWSTLNLWLVLTAWMILSLVLISLHGQLLHLLDSFCSLWVFFGGVIRSG